MKLRTRKQTIIIALLELFLLLTAVYCIVHMAGGKADDHDAKKAAEADLEERRADLGSWNLILVNRWNEIPEGFDVRTADISEEYSIDSRVKGELMAMLADCREAGCDPVICSAYRTHETQESLYEQEAQTYIYEEGMDEEEAYEKAGESVAVPGTSEHECGLAVDIIDEDYQMLDKKQENTDTQKWLMSHCQDYGFILRYPSGRTDTTGIIYEPWHYRYVGKNHAKVIMKEGICLEDYLKELEEA